MGDGRERHDRRLARCGFGRDHVDLFQRLLALPVFRRRFHDHAVLVQGVVDRRHQSLTKIIVERAVDELHRNSQTGGGVAVDDEAGLRALVLRIGAQVGQDGNLAEGLPDARLPEAQFLDIVGLEGVLILGIARATANADVLLRLQKEVGTGFTRELRTQAGNHLVDRNLPLGERFQGNEHIGRIALPAAGKGGDVFHCRVGAYQFDIIHQLLLHRLEGNALVGLNVAHDAAGILLREKALGDDRVEIDVEPHRRRQHQHHQPTVRQRPVQADAISIVQGSEKAFAQEEQAAPTLFTGRTQQAGAHHRRGGEREHQRNQDGDRERGRKFAEEPPDNAAHQQDGDEHGDQRETHRQHGKAHFTRTDERRLKRRFAVLDVARDVFDDDHGIIDDEAGGNGQRHQRQGVEAETGKVHEGKGADQRHRYHDAGNQRRAHVTQEKEDDQHHQHDRNDQRALDFEQRGTDRRRAIHHHLEVDGPGNRGTQSRQQGIHPVDRFDDVGARLAEKNHRHRGLTVHQAGVTQILLRIDHFGHVADTHRCAVAPGDDHRDIVGGPLRLIVGQNLPVAGIVLDTALGPIGVGGDDGGPHLIRADAEAGELRRVEFDTHRRQRGPADDHLANAFDLRNFLRQDG